MSRIANYASQQVLNGYLNKVRNRIQDTQVQLTSEKIAQTYAGIGVDTQRLVGYEVDVMKLTNFKNGNNIQNVYIQTTETALTGVQSTVEDFRRTLTSFNTQYPKDENAVRTIQEQAFRSLQAMQSYLNTEVNGRYIFSGNRANTSPVDLSLGTLESFQAKYDGVNLSYPDNRTTHLENFDLSSDSAYRTDWLTFTQDNDGSSATAGTSTITANTAQFANVSVGSIINVTGTANNNGTYEVAAVTGGGTTIQINTKMLTNETKAATFTKTGGTPFTTDVTFSRSAGTIVAGTTGALSGLTAGSSFTVSGTSQNNGTYIVESNNGTTLKIKESKLTDEGTSAAAVASITGQNFTFTNAPETIDSGVAGTFSSLAAGMKVAIGGTVSNNTTYTVNSVSANGQSITVKEAVTAEVYAGGAGTATVTVATPTLDLVAQSFTFTHNATGFDSIDSGVAGSFSAAKPGMQVTIGGSTNNNATFTIATVSTDGKSITVLETLTTEAPVGANDTALISRADGTISSDNYYNGDSLTRTHRASSTRDFTLDLNAIDPAFEKAIRAMSMIAQGKFGTAGGLEQTANEQRVTDAVNLLDLSLKYNDAANPKYEENFTNSIEQSFVTLGYQRSIIETANSEHTRLIGFFEERVAKLENIDQLDVITRLLDDQKALEASYQAMASVRGLSLHNYLT